MRGFTSAYGAPPIPIPAPTPAIPGELARLSAPGLSEADVDRNCAARLKAAADIVRAPAGGGSRRCTRRRQRRRRSCYTSGVDRQRGRRRWILWGVPYVFRDIADNVDDPKLILSDGFVPRAEWLRQSLAASSCFRTLEQKHCAGLA